MGQYNARESRHGDRSDLSEAVVERDQGVTRGLLHDIDDAVITVYHPPNVI